MKAKVFLYLIPVLFFAFLQNLIWDTYVIAAEEYLIPESLDLVKAAEQQELIIVAFNQETQEMVIASGGASLDDIPLQPLEDVEMEAEQIKTIPDPFEPINRVFFVFNDKLYFWVIKPLAKGYSAVLPEMARVRIKNFFTNLATPIRIVGCILQGKFRQAWDEVIRVIVNTCVGFLGFEDVAKQAIDLPERDEDIGQALGFYGFGPGFYICWPFFGPSSLRDWIGGMSELFIDPINYIARPWKYNFALRGYRQVNKTSLSFDDYEALKDTALDPYVAVRDAYHQYRLNKIKE